MCPSFGSMPISSSKVKKTKKSEAPALSTISIDGEKETRTTGAPALSSISTFEKKETKTKTSTRELPSISYDVIGESEYEIADKELATSIKKL